MLTRTFLSITRPSHIRKGSFQGDIETCQGNTGPRQARKGPSQANTLPCQLNAGPSQANTLPCQLNTGPS